MRLDGKVAIISGGAHGMGAEEARLFASEGAAVVTSDVLEKQGKQVEAELVRSGGDGHVRACRRHQRGGLGAHGAYCGISLRQGRHTRQ